VDLYVRVHEYVCSCVHECEMSACIHQFLLSKRLPTKAEAVRNCLVCAFIRMHIGMQHTPPSSFPPSWPLLTANW